MPAPQFFPALSNLIGTENLPEPIKSAFDKVSDKLFYKTYYVEKSIYGDTAYHNLVLVLKGNAGINIFGGDDGLQLLFNPGTSANTIEIPIALYYRLPILKYLRRITLNELSTIEDYFNLILEMFGISKPELVFEAFDIFLDGYDDTVLAFVNQFNANSNYSEYQPLPLPQTGNQFSDITELISFFESFGLDINLYILETYIDGSDLSKGFENMSLLFDRFLGEFSIDTLIDLFIPRISVALQSLNLALAFPRNMLQPVDGQGNVIDDGSKSLLTYNVGSLLYDTKTGFDFINPDTFQLTRSQIGNSGFILEVTNLKLDLKDNTNIPEADAYGYGPEFKGIYAQSASITLPKK
ncbi:hypothetical protein ESY86_15785 [Subsaximicrobium wynnwilliamsii]|uniref:Uncharacterized protein n=1 Tax=Subsaximicrobium wynnwilliamsii TaxID=291179 RepID=A0A5C6ZCK5_9FLAO|nr:hypothetical protein [Subsaximicrobium wynnwilliamsii]TXD82126.1 hypothetical protein ESY87_15375 [Subsaximicrobium wynnwilliamsii]TXD87771.1 hypothetical protein ESY86_15785 [Subsaximicrobium wynnwilliamsii]TXE01582.1 hypothetical protein ESY88_15365 [Subsaximicrobium wynnwilliamsii]